MYLHSFQKKNVEVCKYVNAAQLCQNATGLAGELIDKLTRKGTVKQTFNRQMSQGTGQAKNESILTHHRVNGYGVHVLQPSETETLLARYRNTCQEGALSNVKIKARQSAPYPRADPTRCTHFLRREPK
jgi:hypothetical protein